MARARSVVWGVTVGGVEGAGAEGNLEWHGAFRVIGLNMSINWAELFSGDGGIEMSRDRSKGLRLLEWFPNPSSAVAGWDFRKLIHLSEPPYPHVWTQIITCLVWMMKGIEENHVWHVHLRSWSPQMLSKWEFPSPSLTSLLTGWFLAGKEQSQRKWLYNPPTHWAEFGLFKVVHTILTWEEWSQKH